MICFKIQKICVEGRYVKIDNATILHNVICAQNIIHM